MTGNPAAPWHRGGEAQWTRPRQAQGGQHRKVPCPATNMKVTHVKGRVGSCSSMRTRPEEDCASLVLAPASDGPFLSRLFTIGRWMVRDTKMEAEAAKSGDRCKW